MIAATLTMLAFTALPSDVPDWALRGILAVESASYYDQAGRIVWVDRKRGAAGERGPFQCTAAAFADVRLPGERFADIEADPIFAEVIACRYLARIYRGSWQRAIEGYNAGPGHRSPTYFRLVQRAGVKK